VIKYVNSNYSVQLMQPSK